jgi:hypothetical protein
VYLQGWVVVKTVCDAPPSLLFAIYSPVLLIILIMMQ